MKGAIKGRDSPPYSGGGFHDERSNKMTNEDVIINLSWQIEAVAKRIGEIAAGISVMREARPMVSENYGSFLLDEVAHLQILALDLTQVVTEGETGNGDEAFGPGELTDVAEEEKEEPEPLPEKETE